MLSLALGLTIMREAQADTGFFITYIGDPTVATTRLRILQAMKRLDPPKNSPKLFGEEKVPYQFDWVSTGDIRLEGTSLDSFKRRVQVYSQQKRVHDELAPNVSRTVLRLWDMTYQRYRLDHSTEFNNGIVDVYLCFGGQAGGEQMFDSEVVNGRTVKVNTIYIYDLASFTDPVEMLREVCHEYGHAVLWAVGGYTEPEYWANGYLGEKLYMRYLRDELKAARFGTLDSIGSKFEALDAWVKKNADPLEDIWAKGGPKPELLKGNDGSAMNAYIGLSLYAERVLPPSSFQRAMKQAVGNGTAPELLAGIVSQIEGRAATTLNIPEEWRKQPFWIPVGAKGRVAGATVLKSQDGWVQVRAGAGSITVTSPGN
jgi:hypothetical protein